MRSSSLRAPMVAAAALLACAAAQTGAAKSAFAANALSWSLVAQADEPFRLGRASIQQVSVVQGSLAVQTVALKAGSKAGKLLRVDATGDGLRVALLKEQQRFPIELASALDIELPTDLSLRIEVTLDAKLLAVGAHQGKLLLTIDGAKLELPIEWDVIEPPKANEDDLPIPKPQSDWVKYTTDGPQPRVTCDRYRHDFGKRLSGERLETQFTIKNEGEGDLVIIKVGAQCHCTLSELRLPGRVVSPKELQLKEAYGTLKPGEQATLDCTVDTAGLAGSVRKKIQVYTSDRARSPLSLDMVMVVDNPFQLSPASISFGDVRYGEPVERVVRMASIDQGEFAIVGHELPQPPVMEVEYKQVKPRRNEVCVWEITLRSKDGLPCKEHFGKLKLTLDHPTIKSLDQLHYSMRVVPDVAWTVDSRRSPETITLGVVKAGTNDVRSIMLENKNPKVPYKATGVTITSRLGTEAFAAELITIEEGQKYEVKLKVIAAPKSKAFSGELAIAAESPTLPLLKIKFSGIWSGNIAGGTTPVPAAPAPAPATPAVPAGDGGGGPDR